ncbi:hypothetical protein CK203_029122 [Vitis vinifera]|uniref:Retrovirus-related Pol polyprotein from transposon RE2 n=1 Tax=Vitis vinifera TaxID=29760 RepID=A0A438IN23_VITVI|nr:hypothetical protein CK203_029122 [Vitis vinifera]
MITSEKLVGVKIIFPGLPLLNFGYGSRYEASLIHRRQISLRSTALQWRKIDAQLCSVLWQSVDPRILLHLQAYKTCFKFWTQAKGLYTNDIQRLYKRASAIVHLSQQDLDLSTYIGQIASLKEQFLTVMPLTPDVGAQQTQLESSSALLLSASVRILSLFVIRFLVVHQFRPWMMCLLASSVSRPLRLCHLISASDSSVLVSQNYLSRRTQWYPRPPRTAHMAQSSDSPLPQPPSSSASQTSQASIASVAQPGNASACLTHTSSLGPWILDSEHLITYLDRSYGEDDWHRRESQGLYHLTSDSSPAVCISTDAPLLIHNRLGHPISPSSRRWFLVFPLCRRFRVSHVSLGNILVSRSQSV